MKDKTKTVSEAELQAAIRKFLNGGGIIQKLPDQKSAESRVIGMNWNTSELASERS